ncbi:MAG: hypothetical protein IPI55_16445 [Flavobacteriales bacterium]|nr:hypothetical protein [Flavobacteriales bacterium]
MTEEDCPPVVLDVASELDLTVSLVLPECDELPEELVEALVPDPLDEEDETAHPVHASKPVPNSLHT